MGAQVIQLDLMSRYIVSKLLSIEHSLPDPNKINYSVIPFPLN
jgi:hypothetical protein